MRAAIRSALRKELSYSLPEVEFLVYEYCRPGVIKWKRRDIGGWICGLAVENASGRVYVWTEHAVAPRTRVVCLAASNGDVCAAAALDESKIDRRAFYRSFAVSTESSPLLYPSMPRVCLDDKDKRQQQQRAWCATGAAGTISCRDLRTQTVIYKWHAGFEVVRLVLAGDFIVLQTTGHTIRVHDKEDGYLRYRWPCHIRANVAYHRASDSLVLIAPGGSITFVEVDGTPKRTGTVLASGACLDDCSFVYCHDHTDGHSTLFVAHEDILRAFDCDAIYASATPAAKQLVKSCVWLRHRSRDAHRFGRNVRRRLLLFFPILFLACWILLYCLLASLAND